MCMIRKRKQDFGPNSSIEKQPRMRNAALALSTKPQKVYHDRLEIAQTRLNSFKNLSQELMPKSLPRFSSTPIPFSFYLGDFRNSDQKTMKFRVLFPTIFFIKYFRIPSLAHAVQRPSRNDYLSPFPKNCCTWGGFFSPFCGCNCCFFCCTLPKDKVSVRRKKNLGKSTALWACTPLKFE